MASKRKNDSGGNAGPIIATLKTAVDAGERLGVDAAIYLLLIIFSFFALLTIHPLSVAGLDFIFIVGWDLNRYLRDRHAEQKAWISLERVKQTKGYELLRRYMKEPKQLSWLNGDRDDDVREQ